MIERNPELIEREVPQSQIFGFQKEETKCLWNKKVRDISYESYFLRKLTHELNL